jgi:hypothetical protein
MISSMSGGLELLEPHGFSQGRSDALRTLLVWELLIIIIGSLLAAGPAMPIAQTHQEAARAWHC